MDETQKHVESAPEQDTAAVEDTQTNSPPIIESSDDQRTYFEARSTSVANAGSNNANSLASILNNTESSSGFNDNFEIYDGQSNIPSNDSSSAPGVATGSGTRTGQNPGESPGAKDQPKAPDDRIQQRNDWANWMDENFSAMDSNADSSISISELENKMLDPEFAQGDNAVNLVTAHNQFRRLKGFGERNSEGITQAGLDNFQQLNNDPEFYREIAEKSKMAELEGRWANLDTNKNSFLSVEEVDTALNSEAFKGDKETLQKLKDYMSTLNSQYVDGGGFALVRPNPTDLHRAEVANLTGNKAAAIDGVSNSLDRADRRLEAAKKDGDRVSQGVDGSCFLLAAYESLKQSDPDAASKLITDNENGTHSVNFPGLPDKPITVSTPTDAEMANWAHGKNAAIIEKAFGQYYKDYQFAKDERLNYSTSEIPSARIQGGLAEDALRFLTGKQPTTVELDSSKTDEELQVALKESKGATMTADTSPYTRRDTGLLDRHSYSAVYDEESNSVRLQNPIKPDLPNSNNERFPFEPFNEDGSPRDGGDDGSFTMPLSEFKKHFRSVSYIK